MKKIFLTLALITGMIASAQVRIGGTGTAVDANAILELQSSTKGLLFPKVALTSTTAFAPLAAHTAGMTVYNTATAGDVTPGLYANNGAAWVKLGGSTPAYQDIRGTVTTVTSTTYTALTTDNVIITNATAGVTITLPALTLADAGRIIYIINDNTGAFANTITALPTALPFGGNQNQFRGRAHVWTGTKWLIIAQA
jgi:hypothetical protein